MEINVNSFGYVYRVTNSVNGKTYVGKHKTKPGESWLEYLGSGRIILFAISKYGRDAFTKDFLGYAFSEEELSDLEIECIKNEASNGGCEYNISFTDFKNRKDGTTKTLEASPILEWYFDDKLSTREIANRMKCSQPLVVARLNALRTTDERFATVMERVGLKQRPRSPAVIEKQRATFASSEAITCFHCGEAFKSNVIKLHLRTCRDNPAVQWPACEICEVRLSKKSAKRCRTHLHVKT